MKALGEKRNKVEVISDSHGRAVRLSINGSITFFYWYRWNGKAVQLTIGDYPFASLSYSREQGLQCRLWLAEGGDSGRQTLFKQQKKTMLSPRKDAIVYCIPEGIVNLILKEVRLRDFSTSSVLLVGASDGRPG